jgi:hypothetical protein
MVGDLSWTKLGSLQYGGQLTSHVRALQELYTLYRPRDEASGVAAVGPDQGDGGEVFA